MESTRILRTNSENKDFYNLFRELDAELRSYYGNEQNVYDEHNLLEKLDTVIVVYLDNHPVACGCFKPYEENTIEVKRMFVNKLHRGKGLSKILLDELESWAKDLVYRSAVLETGRLQKAAIGLYEKQGYKRIEKYGVYKDMPNSICFGKTLANV